jgi:hypothetical protein
MYIKQISVFLENTKGSLSRLTRLLSKAGVDLVALTIADTEQYGIMRCIVSDTELGLKIMKEAGYVARLTDVVGVSVPDQPGGLAEVLKLLNAADVAVEYLYSFVRTHGSHAMVIFRLSDNEKGIRVLQDGDIELLTQEEVRSL